MPSPRLDGFKYLIVDKNNEIIYEKGANALCIHLLTMANHT
jgi:hypothetical protein